jgi:capsid protein
MNFESTEPNNLHDMILFLEKYLANMSRQGKGGRTQFQIQGISFDQMKRKRDYLVELREKEKKINKETKEFEESNNEFMKYVLNELIRINILKEKFMIENGIGDA